MYRKSVSLFNMILFFIIIISSLFMSDHPAQAGWAEIPGGGRGKDIAVDGRNRPWVIGMDNAIYYNDGGRWHKYPGNGLGFTIAIGVNGKPWVIGMNNGIWYIYQNNH